MRLTDATTESHHSETPAGIVDGTGAPWCNYLDDGDGVGSITERYHASSRLDGISDGTHGTSNGDGMSTNGEYHVFGGNYMHLTLLDVWGRL